MEEGVSSRIIVKGFRTAARLAENKIKEISVKIDQTNKRDTLLKLASTAMSSKLIKRNSVFFAEMVVNAVAALDQSELNEKLIGMKKVPGGGLQDSLFVNGVAFKKTFSYAGFEQQPKTFTNPKIVCLNVELELKSEKDNAEVRVEQVSVWISEELRECCARSPWNLQDYQAIVDAEWQIIFQKLQALADTGAQVVLSKLPIGDLATQHVGSYTTIIAGDR